MFDFFKKKDKKQIIQPEKITQQNDNYKILTEFFYHNNLTQDRMDKIGIKFIDNAIINFKTTFDKTSIDELNYDELANIYNNIEVFVNRNMPLINNAIEYKLFLRQKILQLLSNITTYVIIVNPTHMPLMLDDNYFCLYTDKTYAQNAINSSSYNKYLSILEIKPENFIQFFCKCFITGYKFVDINENTIVKIEDIYKVKPIEDYGNICIESCKNMITYKQIYIHYLANAENEKRDLNGDEWKIINTYSWEASSSLLNDNLLQKATTDKEGNFNGFIMEGCEIDGKFYCYAFTDQNAICEFYNDSVPSFVSPKLIESIYHLNHEGIIVNPGREEYIITIEMLEQLFSESK